MTAPLSADQQARLARIEAAPEAEEACRMQVAAAIHRVFAKLVATGYVSPTQIEAAADAAIAVLRGPSVADEAVRRCEELVEEWESDAASDDFTRQMRESSRFHAHQLRAALNGGGDR